MLPSHPVQAAKEFADNPDNAMGVVILGFVGCVVLAFVITLIEFWVKGWLEKRGEDPS